MEENLQSSKEILERAIAEHQPYAKVLMFSGGGDSMTALHTCLALGVKPDFILHINTRTGIKETTEFVRWYVESLGIPYIEADSGSRYEDYVLRKGFFGVGTGKNSAHSFAYHVIKKAVYKTAISQYIRKRQRGKKILLLNGARISESKNRAENFANREISWDKNLPGNVWVNVIHHWQKEDCQDFCQERKCPINPVSKELCRSGECLCGTTQSKQTREEASFLFPEWGRWLDNLEARVKEKFPWGWGEPVPKSWNLERMGQLRLFDDDFQPMCHSCNATTDESKNEGTN
jgi:3'-phosphoadenosine 5'-phosphosulfate sulfotransferase (PAPS reductase)/FAD synthetase